MTGSGFVAVSRNSVVMPERARVLKAAADGVSVADPHDRNPVTGDGMPLPDSITDPNGRRQLRTSTAGSVTFRSQFVIADVQGPPPAPSHGDLEPAAARRRERGGKRPSSAHDRMFNTHTPVVGIKTDDDVDEDRKQQPTSVADERMFHTHSAFFDVISVDAVNSAAEQRAQTARKSCSDDEPPDRCACVRVSRKRRVLAPYREPQLHVLAWSKTLGNVEDDSYFIADQPSKRRVGGGGGDVRDATSTVTGETTAASAWAAERSNTSGTPADQLDDGYYCFRGDDDHDGDDELSEAGEDGDTAADH